MTDHTHINPKGEFQSDKPPLRSHPAWLLPPDKIVLSFKDSRALSALMFLASSYRLIDPQLSKDIETRLRTIKEQADG